MAQHVITITRAMQGGEKIGNIINLHYKDLIDKITRNNLINSNIQL